MSLYSLKRGIYRAAWIVGTLSLAFVIIESAARWLYFDDVSTEVSAVKALLEKTGDDESSDPVLEIELRRRAFQADFRERDLPIPPVGPRQGYGGERLPTLKRPCGALEACEGPQHIPFLWSVDDQGRQRVGPRDAERRLLIVGDAVATAPFASTRDTTYFERLHALLADSLPAAVPEIEVVAWRGAHLSAMIDPILSVEPGREPAIVVFLSDPVDETSKLDADTLGSDEAARRYGAALRRAGRTTLRIGARPIFAVAPFLADKDPKSSIEKDLWQRFGQGSVKDLRDRLRHEGRQVAEEEGFTFLDYTDLFSGLQGTYFVDLSQTSDRGQERLARALERDLLPWLQAAEPASQSSSTVSR